MSEDKKKRKDNTEWVLDKFIGELGIMEIRLFTEQNGQDNKWSPANVLISPLLNELRDIRSGESGNTAKRLRDTASILNSYADLFEKGGEA